MRTLPTNRMALVMWLITGVASLSLLLVSADAIYGIVGVAAWCGNSAVAPLLLGANWLLPVFTAASLCLVIQLIPKNGPSPKVVAIVVCLIAMITTYLTYGNWLYQVVLEGTGSMRKSVWWL